MPAPVSNPHRGRRLLGDLFGLDTRSLAVARLWIGLLCVRDAALRFEDLRFFLTDAGAVPRQAVLEHLARVEHLSLFMAGGTTLWAGLLVALYGLSGLAFAAGAWTRWSNAVLWLLAISLQSRNGIVLQSGDVLLRLVLFWFLFLPVGARLSLDHLLSRPTRAPARSVLSVATFAYGLQLALVYVCTAALKTGKVWHNGEAVYYTLQIDHFAKQPFADWLLGMPPLVAGLTHATVWWETAGPLLLLVPVVRGPVRTAVVSGFVLLHLGFFLGLEIGLFPWICMAAWVALFPGWLWDRVGWRVEGREAAYLGSGSVDGTARPRSRRGGVLHNLVAACLVALVVSWNLSTLGGSRWSVPEGPRAVGHLLRLDQKWSMFAPFPMTDDGWYAMPGQLADGRWVDLWNGGEPSWADEAERARWSDADRGGGPAGAPSGAEQWLSRRKPDGVAQQYPNQRWRKYMRNLWLKEYSELRLFFGKARCRDWNAGARGDDRLRTFEIWYMKEETGPPEEGERPVVPVRIWSHECYKRAPHLR